MPRDRRCSDITMALLRENRFGAEPLYYNNINFKNLLTCDKKYYIIKAEIMHNTERTGMDL